MKKVYIASNGCANGRHDTQRYSQFFRLNGWEEIDFPQKADIVLITTCGVTQGVEDFVIDFIKKIQNKIKKDAKLIIGGCVPKINPKRVESLFGGGIFFTKNEENILNQVIDAKIKIEDIFWTEDVLKDYVLFDPVDSIFTKQQFGQRKIIDILNDERLFDIYKYLNDGRFTWREKDLYEVKIADGCNYKCSYCATKNAKGNLVSRDPKKIIKEFKLGVEKGYSKIILMGDELGGYGSDIGMSIIELLDRLVLESKNAKIALRYISPDSIIKNFEGLRKHFATNKIYYFCSSFQSGSQKVLKLMNRSKNIKEFISLMSLISEQYPKVYKHTHAIVGFPQESEEDFEETLNAIKKGGFDYVEILKYSPRPHTEALNFSGQIDISVINDRYNRAIKLVSDIKDLKFKERIIKEYQKNP